MDATFPAESKKIPSGQNSIVTDNGFLYCIFISVFDLHTSMSQEERGGIIEIEFECTYSIYG